MTGWREDPVCERDDDIELEAIQGDWTNVKHEKKSGMTSGSCLNRWTLNPLEPPTCPVRLTSSTCKRSATGLHHFTAWPGIPAAPAIAFLHFPNLFCMKERLQNAKVDTTGDALEEHENYAAVARGMHWQSTQQITTEN